MLANIATGDDIQAILAELQEMKVELQYCMEKIEAMTEEKPGESLAVKMQKAK